MDGVATMVAVEEEESGDRNKQQNLMCPRCQSTNTKFCYFNNYNKSQPRHFCKTCRRYWTKGGSLRNIPVGGRSRKKRPLPGPPGGNAVAPVVVVGNNNNNNRDLGAENLVAKRMMMNSHLTARSGGVALMMVSSSTAPTPASILGRVGLDVMGSGGPRFGCLLDGNRDCGNILCPTAGIGQMKIAPTISSDNSGGNNNSFLESSTVPTYHFPPHDDFTFWSTGGGVGSNATTTGTGSSGSGGGRGWADVPPKF